MKTSSLSFLKRFLADPFGTIDSVDLHWKGFQLNVLRDDLKLNYRFILPVVVLIPLICWVLLGADSTAEQVAFFVWNLPKFLLGNLTFDGWLQTYSNYYGLGTHWSAAVIYGLLFVGVSKYFREKLEVKNSYNLALTTCFVGLAIGTFELFWMGSFYYFQNQHWILSFAYPQIRIIMQSIIFMAGGVIIIVGRYFDENNKFQKSSFILNFDRRTWLYLAATVGLVLLWWFYPFPVQQLSVPVQGAGVWVSSSNFPQTMYTIDTNVVDKIAAGEMFHIEDPAVHLLNNLCKIFWTLTFYSLAKIKLRCE